MQVDARSGCRAVADRPRLVQLPTLVDDVKLQRKRHMICYAQRIGDAAIESLAMLWRVKPLPRDPEVMLQQAPGEIPRQPGFVRAIVSEGLTLNRRQQLVNTAAIGSDRQIHGWRRQRSEEKRRALAAHRQRNHGPDLFKGVLGA